MLFLYFFECIIFVKFSFSAYRKRMEDVYVYKKKESYNSGKCFSYTTKVVRYCSE